jgi:hypothetical protein
LSRVLNRTVVVETEGGVPKRFRHGGVQEVRRVLESWLEVGEWWEGAEEIRAYRVETAGHGVFELVHRERQGTWLLTRVYD